MTCFLLTIIRKYCKIVTIKGGEKMKGQISLFDGNAPFLFDKPIRLIELFAGYGSQHLALSALGVPFESWKICEWAVKSIQAYKDLHFSNDNFDYSAQLSDSQIIDYLAEKGISANYNEPMTKQQIQRLQADKRRVIYNNIFATHSSCCSCCNIGTMCARF